MLKPIDIHNAEFKRSFKGYNEAEVDAFLAKIVGEYETVLKENKRLQEENEALKGKLAKESHREQDIYDLLALTKQTVAEAKEVATRQAEALLEDAKRQAKRIIADAEEQAQQGKRRAQELERTERLFKERIRKVMEQIWATLGEPTSESKGFEETKVYKEIAPSSQD